MSGRPAKNYSQAARMVAQALHLWKRGRIQPDEESARLGVSRRTIERDLRELQAAFELADLHLEAREGPDGRVEYRMVRDVTLSRHRRWQVLAVVLGVELSHFLGGGRFANDTKALEDELFRELGKGDGGRLKQTIDRLLYVVKTGRKDYRDRKEVIGALSNVVDALMENRRLRLTYYSPASKRERQLAVLPLSLVMNRGALYVVVELLEPAERLPNRILLAIDRMSATSVDLESPPLPYPADFDANDFFASAFEIVTGPVEHVVLAVSPEHLPYLLEHFWHRSARFEQEGEVTSLHLDVAIGVDLENWILGMADRVVVREPAVLRRKIEDRLAAALATYRA